MVCLFFLCLGTPSLELSTDEVHCHFLVFADGGGAVSIAGDVDAAAVDASTVAGGAESNGSRK